MFSLEKISYKNFFSFGNELTEIDFTKAQSFLFSGRNGAGKSTTVEAIHYALFGKPYRNEVTLDKIPNRINKEKCYVKLEFSSNGSSYIIERGLKPKLLTITKDGTQLKENVGKKDFNQHLIELIGLDTKVFSQLSIIDNTFYVPFMALNASQRRAIIDTVFGLDEIGDMLKKAREAKSTLNTEIETKKSALELLKEKIKLNKQNSEEKKQRDLEEIDQKITFAQEEGKKAVGLLADEEIKLKDQSDLKAAIVLEKNNSNKELQDMKRLVQEKELLCQKQINEAQNKIKDEINENNYKLKDIAKRIDLIKNGKCSHCGQAFENFEEEIKTLNEDKKSIDQKVVDMNQKLVDKKKELTDVFNFEVGELKKTIVPLEEELSKMDLRISPFDKKIIEISSQISFYNKTIREYASQIKTLEARKIEVEKQTFPNVEELEKESAEKEKEIIKSAVMLSGLIESEKILSDSGVRSYIIAKFLPIFNATMKKYLDMMEANFSFMFDQQFEDISDDRFRNSMSYGSLSTGQRARVNFAITFALIDFVEKKNNIKTNFIVIDEGLDGLDAEGRADIFNILKNNVKKKLIVISHDNSIVDLFEKKIKVELSGSFSKVTWS
jgi:DNA repair exonuclease SbcCD ATPase subunit